MILFRFPRNFAILKTWVSFCLMQVTGKLTALKGLDSRLREIRSYLDLVVDEKLPLNHEILYHLQVQFLFNIDLDFLTQQSTVTW